MKVSELGKEFGLKAHDILNFAKDNGFVLSSHSQKLTETEEAELRRLLSGQKDEELEAIDVVKFVGLYYDHRKLTYRLYSMVLPPSKLSELPLVEEYSGNTIYKINNKLGGVFTKLGFLVESAVQKLMEKRRKS